MFSNFHISKELLFGFLFICFVIVVFIKSQKQKRNVKSSFSSLADRFKGAFTNDNEELVERFCDLATFKLGRRTRCSNALTFNEGGSLFALLDIDQLDETEADHENSIRSSSHRESFDKKFFACIVTDNRFDLPHLLLRRKYPIFEKNMEPRISSVIGPCIDVSMAGIEKKIWALHSTLETSADVIHSICSIANKHVKSPYQFWLELKHDRILLCYMGDMRGDYLDLLIEESRAIALAFLRKDAPAS